MDSLPPRSPIKKHHRNESKGEIPSVSSEFPASFFQTSLNFSNQDFGRKRYQTDSFALDFPNSLHSGFDAFSYPTKTASIIADDVKKVQRSRASSFSIPNDLSPFGSSMFSSVWSPINPSEVTKELSKFEFTDRFAPAVEESDDINAFSRTIGYLGLDDPLASSPTNNSEIHPRRTNDFNRPRSISVSFPTVLEESNDVGGFSGRTLSSMAIMSEAPESVITTRKPVSPSSNQTWQELTERFQSISTEDSGEKNIAINSLSSLTQDPSYISENSIPSRSLWIGNIDLAQTADDLNQLFCKFGTIESIRMLPDKECAFVNFVCLDDALKAREAMQGSRIGNCVVRIGFGKTEAFHDAQGTNPTKSLWVGNILPNTKPSELEAIFSQFGAVESARILTHKNCGFVNFVSLQDAIIARQELNGKDIGGACIKIGFAKVPSKVDSPITAAQVFSSPAILASLVPSAAERLSAWQKSSSSNRTTFSPSSKSPNISSTTESIEFIPDSSIYYNLDYIPILPIPELCPPRKKHDQSRLRDFRKKLESQHISTREVDQIFTEIIDDADDLCSDYIGNVVIQKIMEKSGDEHRLLLIKKVAPLMAPLGIHKNGTWAVQKIIELAKQKDQIEVIVEALKPFAPALLLDQFGNYVIQCCLRLGLEHNQFIFDAIASKILEIGQGRFGARATKACLESQHISIDQQRKISSAIVQNCVPLSMNANGAILLTWLLDGSVLPGRYRVLAPIMIPHLAHLACNKLASGSLLKIVMQRNEMDARELIMTEIFKEKTLAHILSDQNSGIPFVTKILSSCCISTEERSKLVTAVRKLLEFNRPKPEGNMKRLCDELTSNFFNGRKSEELDNSDARSNNQARPLMGNETHSPVRSSNGDPKFTALPTPHQSPNYAAPTYTSGYYNNLKDFI